MSEPDGAPPVPRDGQEFVDGETYADDDEGVDDPYDYYRDTRSHYHDDYYDDYPYDPVPIPNPEPRTPNP